MSRKGYTKKREAKNDPIFGDRRVAKFISIIMRHGKKSTAEGIAYGALEIIKERSRKESELKGDSITIFFQALNNVKPMIEVKSRRVGGATYQVPVEVRQDRQESLGMRWLVDAASDRNENSMPERLAAEIVEAFYKRGGAVKKREDVHRMAEANKAFAHYRW